MPLLRPILYTRVSEHLLPQANSLAAAEAPLCTQDNMQLFL